MVEFDKENIEESIINNLGKFINDPENEKNLDVKVVENASNACRCIIMWINGVYKFYFVNRKVKPKKKSLNEANTKVYGLYAQLNEKQKKTPQSPVKSRQPRPRTNNHNKQ